MLLIELVFLFPKILEKFIERLLFQNPVELRPVITDQTDALHDNVIRAPPRRAQKKPIINPVFSAVLQLVLVFISTLSSTTISLRYWILASPFSSNVPI